MDLKRCKRVLTFFAYPNNETLAAGATINKLPRLGSLQQAYTQENI